MQGEYLLIISSALRLSSVLLLQFLINACAPSLQHMSDGIMTAALNQNDPALVRDGLPAYMLMLDGFIVDAPENGALLMSGAKLYAFYASAVLDADVSRAQRLTETARDYAGRALCLKHAKFCEPAVLSYDDYAVVLNSVHLNALPELYSYGLAWSAWLQSRSRDWQALADRPKIEALFERVLALDETYDGGRAHFYLAILRSQLPPGMGGNPETGKTHFERAIALSQGKDLAVKVQYAQLYARMVFNRALHDRLLREVLQADPHAPGLTLSNVLAQQQARRLLDESPHFFQE